MGEELRVVRTGRGEVWGGIIRHYAHLLPVTEKTPVITLLEGNTPLIPATRFQDSLRADVEVFFKFEGANPTGSFKDRGMTVAVSKAVEDGCKAVVCASTGNTSAAAAAYSAKAGLDCIVLIPKNAVAMGKLAQAIIHGAKVVAIEGNFDQALKLVRQLAERHPIRIVNSVNPHRIEGQKTAAFEICDVLGDAPEFLIIPVGNAGNITAYWKGFKEYHMLGRTSRLPRMIGIQAEGAAPIVKGHPIENPQTIATAIRIGNPVSWKGALSARDESGGIIDCVSDEEIIEAYKLLARTEGLFVEPASAAAVAGLLKLCREGYFEQFRSLDGKKPKVVVVLTGHGLKDPAIALEVVPRPLIAPPDLKFVEKELGYA